MSEPSWLPSVVARIWGNPNHPLDAEDIAARTAWGEARGDGRAGMTGVICVGLNRARNPGWWGSTLITVFLEPEQFDCWDAVDPNLPQLLAVTGADPLFTLALAIAGPAVAGTLADITDGADSYYALGTPQPSWATPDRYRCTLGTQAFYRVGV